MDERVRTLRNENWKILKSLYTSIISYLDFSAKKTISFGPSLAVYQFYFFLAFWKVQNHRIYRLDERVMNVTSQNVETGSNSHKVAAALD